MPEKKKMPAQNSEGTVGWGTGEGGHHKAGYPGEEIREARLNGHTARHTCTHGREVRCWPVVIRTLCCGTEGPSLWKWVREVACKWKNQQRNAH